MLRRYVTENSDQVCSESQMLFYFTLVCTDARLTDRAQGIQTAMLYCSKVCSKSMHREFCFPCTIFEFIQSKSNIESCVEHAGFILNLSRSLSLLLYLEYILPLGKNTCDHDFYFFCQPDVTSNTVSNVQHCCRL